MDRATRDFLHGLGIDCWKQVLLREFNREHGFIIAEYTEENRNLTEFIVELRECNFLYGYLMSIEEKTLINFMTEMHKLRSPSASKIERILLMILRYCTPKQGETEDHARENLAEILISAIRDSGGELTKEIEEIFEKKGTIEI
ncbi:MAG: hypothetical protein GY793_07295 [Proteobacteria bacterium]|nr:hypothetical protein [Pseudomonadota bacterium]